MDPANHRDVRRSITFVVVLGLHAALLVLIANTSSAPVSVETTPPPVQIVLLPLPDVPRIRAQSPPPRHLSNTIAILVAPPVFNADTLAASTSGADGRGSGVDWTAEARRAKQAYEIRSFNPAGNYSRSHSPGEDSWWPRAEHHAGEQYKTESGDWIVWINSRCYELASSASRISTDLPQTICPQERRGPRQGQAGQSD